ncbi:MAG: hypothetical protein ACOC1X_00095 [Promethearchaeota archaeon]
MRTKKEILGNMGKVEFDMRCKYDFKFFCEKMLGLTDMGGIHDFQKDWINTIEKYRISMIEAPSGSSKSEIVGACYPLWELYRNPDKRLEIRLVSKTRDQSEKNLLVRTQNYILDNEILSNELVPSDKRVSWTKSGFRTKKGDVMDIVPYNVNIKGSRAHIMILDEIDSYEDHDIFFKHVLSRTHAGGRVVGISTPEHISGIIEQLKEKKLDFVGFHKTTVFVHPDGTNVKPEEIQSIEDFDRLKEQGCKSIWPENEKFTFNYMREDFQVNGRLSWIQNYLCEIIGLSEDAAFPLKSIIESYNYDLDFDYSCNPNAMYFIGADFATSDGPKADYDAFVVVELLDNAYTIKQVQTGKGIHPETKVKELKRLYDMYSKSLSVKVVADESNAGSILIKMIRAGGMTVIPQKFSGVARFELIQTASNILQSGYVKIPKNPKNENTNETINTLQTQLAGFKRSKTDKGNETFLSKAAHDDIAISFCMAVKEASKQVTTYVKGTSR